MARETAREKAKRYLTEGRVIVTTALPGLVEATARGGTVYRVGYSPGKGWTCTCPHPRPTCSHLRALRTITAPDIQPPPAAINGRDRL